MRNQIFRVSLAVFLVGGLAALANAVVRVGKVSFGKSGVVTPMLPGPRLPVTPFIHNELKLAPTLLPISLPQVTIPAAGAAVNSVAMPKSVTDGPVPWVVAPAAGAETKNDHRFKPAVVAGQIAGMRAAFGMKDGSAKADDRASRPTFDGGTTRGGDKTGELDEALAGDGAFSIRRPSIFRPARRVSLDQGLEDDLGIQGW